jgi:translation initiation factor 1
MVMVPPSRMPPRKIAVRPSPSPMSLVYSTDSGRMCPVCRQAMALCTCKPAPLPAGDGVVRVSREKQGRAGRWVTLARGMPGDAAELAAWGKRLRNACGAGGTVKLGVLEVQGDHVDRVVALLAEAGLRVKRAGG